MIWITMEMRALGWRVVRAYEPKGPRPSGRPFGLCEFLKYLCLYSSYNTLIFVVGLSVSEKCPADAGSIGLWSVIHSGATLDLRSRLIDVLCLCM